MINQQSKNPLPQLDLNLLRLFIHIYELKNLTHTADLLHISQSAVSHALSRLRHSLSDELFIRENGELRPTPYAKRLYPTIKQTFANLEQVFATHDNLNDEELQRLAKQSFDKLTIAMQDEIELIVFARLFAKLNSLLPNCHITSSRLKRQNMGKELGNGTLDFAIDVARAVENDIHHQLLINDDFVVTFYQPNFDKPVNDKLILNEKSYFEHAHITVSSRRLGDSLEDRLLSQAGKKRHVAIRCQHYATACQLLKEGQFLLTLPSQLVSVFIPQESDWQVVTMPFDLPKIALHGYWHESQHSDPLHQWLREQIFAVFA